MGAPKEETNSNIDHVKVSKCSGPLPERQRMENIKKVIDAPCELKEEDGRKIATVQLAMPVVNKERMYELLALMGKASKESVLSVLDGESYIVIDPHEFRDAPGSIMSKDMYRIRSDRFVSPAYCLTGALGIKTYLEGRTLESLKDALIERISKEEDPDRKNMMNERLEILNGMIGRRVDPMNLFIDEIVFLPVTERDDGVYVEDNEENERKLKIVAASEHLRKLKELGAPESVIAVSQRALMDAF